MLHEHLTIEYLPEIGSTNDAVKSRAQTGAAEGLVIVAEHQTAARGRRGRSYFTPSGAGAYFSLLLRPTLLPAEAVHITTAAAVAVSRAIDDYAGRATRIKWVNDILLDSRKVCGILTEAEPTPELRALRYAVLGIGVNLVDTAFPAELKGLAGSVFGAKMPENARDELILLSLRYFSEYYARLAEKPHLAEYRRRSAVIGRSVTVLRMESARTARCLDIDDDCRLLVKYGDGTVEALDSGEVSIRPEADGL